jgi:CRP-like cAMP-binding protein
MRTQSESNATTSFAAHTADRTTNRLLSSLPAEEYARVAPLLRTVSLTARQVLHKQGAPVTDVYFPGGGACALVKNMDDGRTTEIATVGAEGVIGASVFFNQHESSCDVVVQLASDTAHVMPADAFRAEMARRGAFYNLVIRYNQGLMTQLMQTTACNGLHSVEKRCCRWLLTTHDRVGRDEFPLTQEFLATMLGVRRPTVTLVATALQQQGLISYRRGHVTIVDREKLEAASCECYATVKATFARLLPELNAAAHSRQAV